MDAKEVGIRAWDLRLNMMRVAMSIVHHGEDAQDAISATILKACQNGASLREEQYFKTWLMRILVRSCYDVLRERKREVLANDFTPYDQPVLENEEGSVFELIQQLSPTYRKVLMLYYYEDFKTKDIAKVLSMPLGTVGVTLSRGRSKLRVLLEKEEAHHEEQNV